MRSFFNIVALSTFTSTAVATWGGENIPWIQNIVDTLIEEYKPVFSYKGPLDHHYHHEAPPSIPVLSNSNSYWLEKIKHQGVAAFNTDKSYKIFRNVKDFGAKGDGVTDDTTAINLAISSGGRCEPGACASTTTTPAVVYFPSGVYNISSSIIDYYYTQIIGNPNSLPIIKAAPGFTGFGLIDGDRYGANGLGFGSTNTFYRQIRNLVFDLTAIPETSAATGIHWPTAQATSIQNCVFKMSDAPGTLHRGIFIEEGSGGFLNDLTFYGGNSGAMFGNQQFTMRNLNIYNAVTAITQLWDWGWTYKNINIHNCSVGLDLSATTAGSLGVGSITLIDSTITDTKVGILTNTSSTSKPETAGSLILENVRLQNVPVAIKSLVAGTLLTGSEGVSSIAGWGQGHKYTPSGPANFKGPISPFPRPGSLLGGGGKFYERSKPQYEKYPLSRFISARSCGARGDGVTDDTKALNSALLKAARTGKILFLDAGDYKVTSTVFIPPGSKIVGEAYSVILGAGPVFSNIKAPKPVVQVGKPGQFGIVEWTDTIVSTQGATAGAILIQWNLASPSGRPSGMWDVHTRIGGFAGSNLQVEQCIKTPTEVNVVKPACIAAFMSMHVTKSASGLYLENVWLWTADHDIEDPNLTQINIFTGRGLYIESGVGNIWLYVHPFLYLLPNIHSYLNCL
jgi:glucan 1,3-beta-glucosidase